MARATPGALDERILDPDEDLPLPGFTTAGSEPPTARRVRLGAIGEFCVSLLGVTFWLLFRPAAFVDAPFMPGPGWTDPYPFLLIPLAMGIVASGALLIRPDRPLIAAALGRLDDVVLLGLVLWSLALGDWLLVDPATATADQLRLAALADGGVTVALAVTAVVVVWSIVEGALKIRRLRQASLPSVGALV